MHLNSSPTRPRRSLRLLSCHRSVEWLALLGLTTKPDGVRYSANKDQIGSHRFGPLDLGTNRLWLGVLFVSVTFVEASIERD